MASRLIILMLASASVAQAEGARQPLDAARAPFTLDIAGVRLGMTKEQAASALQPRYSCRPFGHTQNFQQRVESEVAKRKGSSPFTSGGAGIMQLLCKGPNQEELTVDMSQLQGGDIVRDVKLFIPGASVDQTSVRAQISGKYGKPTVGNIRIGSWCNSGYRCGAATVFAEGAQLTVDATGSNTTIMATSGRSIAAADAAAVQAAADKIAPKKARAKF